LSIAEYIGVLGLKEVLLLNSVIGKLFSMVSRLASYDRFLTRILCEFVDAVPKTYKVKLDGIDRLAMVETDLNPTISSANTSEVILFYSSVNNVLAS
jgi:hypothetical protein